MNRTKILFIDEDQRVCRLVKKCLKNCDFEVVCTRNASDALNLLHDESLPDASISLILLDMTLPDMSGLTLAQTVRQTSSVPIIFLTSKTEIENKITAFEIGADDYITRPFDERELVARIQAVLRRSRNPTMPDINKAQANFAGWQLNLLSHKLLSPKGKTVDITSTEYRLLAKLLNRSNQTIKREEILSILSDREWSPLDRSADMAISKLRKKIEINPRKPEIIKTIRNHGYKLTAAIHFEKV